ncbi:MAG TPA: hypothetical protein PKW24_05255 [Clostridiales bacterium]|nr:hypothetical protein [Clostridiales bacterium]
MEVTKDLLVEIKSYAQLDSKYDFDRIIYDLDSEIEILSSQADKFDYLVAIASGLLCGVLDIFWTGEFNLINAKKLSNEKMDKFVVKIANLLGHKGKDLKGAVEFLEGDYHIPSDGNINDFGGGLQHHLRDFSHHPTIVGLIFSLLNQFTGKSYGTDVNGQFVSFDVPELSKQYIGKDIPTKIFYGTIKWFFHLVSDMAGSRGTAGGSGGTGIPGPLLSFAKELSSLPLIQKIKIGDSSFSKFVSKLFNGTLLAKRGLDGKIDKESILRFDLRAELGVASEMKNQALPIVANECIVKAFYFIRRLALEIREKDIKSISEFSEVEWEKVRPRGNPTIVRMLTIATGVFTTVDVSEAVITQKYFVSVNYAGVGRFAVALGNDVVWILKARNVKKLKEMYEGIQRNVYTQKDNRYYERLGDGMNNEKMGLTLEQTEILYSIEYLKTQNDIENTKLPVNSELIKLLKKEWLREWKEYISKGYSSFVQIEGAELRWYEKEELLQKIEENNPQGTWFRLLLLEAMLFEPYFPLEVEKNKKGQDVPSKKYSQLQVPKVGYSKSKGDAFLSSFFDGNYYLQGYIDRLRKTHNKVIREMKEVLKGALITVAVVAGSLVVTVATAGALAPQIAVVLVGSSFSGLSGAALTSASLAYLGGGAIAAGGAGMLGGTAVIVGGGALVGLGVGGGVGGALGIASAYGKKNMILQSAKLLVAVREIFLNDEHDIELSDSIYELYVENIMEIEKGLVELRLEADVAKGSEKKELKAKIKNAEEAVEAMKIARKSLLQFKSSFGEALQLTE